MRQTIEGYCLVLEDGEEHVVCAACAMLPDNRNLNGGVIMTREAVEDKVTCDDCGRRLAYTLDRTLAYS